jgi:3-hydroxyacyl-CoA dehydrogenase/enoyl-CoA hydratase/3-hydroxybutyryl-CoA epimerase/enoyl-CoA isomerase
MGKTPIVVKDCPGFYVNRVLFPYLAGFNLLVRDGADYQAVDKIMEKFGWPMGPAYLLDVVGIDTAKHAADVMAQGFPERMNFGEKGAMELVFNADRYGQKNGKGFYQYQEDKKGRPLKVVDAAVAPLIAPAVERSVELSEEDIIDRLMIPMCNEVVRCIEEGIVGSAADADLGLIMGIGFPVFRGGAVRYMETLGLQVFCDKADKFADLGPLYAPTDKLRKMAANNQSFFA